MTDRTPEVMVFLAAQNKPGIDITEPRTIAEAKTVAELAARQGALKPTMWEVITDAGALTLTLSVCGTEMEVGLELYSVPVSDLYTVELGLRRTRMFIRELTDFAARVGLSLDFGDLTCPDSR
jgi:hypothetical protein